MGKVGGVRWGARGRGGRGRYGVRSEKGKEGT